MNEALEVLTAAAHLDCFGAFDPADPICRRHCALRLRCAIEREQHHRLRQIEELVEAEEPNLRSQ